MRAIFLFAAGLVASVSAPVLAQTAPPSAFTITGGATLTSDYRFRGISQSDKRVAIQGTLTVSHSSGFYVGTWGSSIDDYIANGGDAEVDLFGGFKKTFNGTTVDVGMLYYYYPGSGGINSDFFEPYANVSHTFGPVGVKVGTNFAWKQHGLASVHSRDDAFYLYGELSAAIPKTGLTITGHVGHSFDRDYITFSRPYTDWTLTAAYTLKQFTISGSYVDTDRHFHSYPLGGGHDRVISGAGFVGSVGVAF